MEVENNGLKGLLGCGTIFWGIVILLIGSCMFQASKPRPTKEELVENIDRIVMHETNYYSFLVGEKFRSFRTMCMGDGVEFKFDVPASKKPYAVVYWEDKFLDGWRCMYITIHCHNPQDIYAGGWNHGKFGKGQNTIIE
jgi:hypothetical protein